LSRHRAALATRTVSAVRIGTDRRADRPGLRRRPRRRAMTEILFGPLYASAYDALHEDKDYERECDLFERTFDELAAGGVRRVLDLGCGTGGHAIPLARRGYDVVGVDRSEAMLARAADKAARGPLAGSLSFRHSD